MGSQHRFFCWATSRSMSALPPKADIRPDQKHVRFVPNSCREQVQQTTCYSITSSARASSDGGI